MSSVGRLRAQLRLDSGPFKRGLKKSEGHARGFAARVGRSMALAGAAMAAAAVVGVGAFTKRSLEFIDEQAKVARSIDGTVDGLRAMQLAGSDAGVATGDLNKSMQLFNMRLAEADVKGGASADALGRLGLKASELSAMDVDDRMATVSDRLVELGYSSGQASQFLSDMGVRSKEMAVLMTAGGGAIRAAREEIQDLGLSLSAVDSAAVERANDAMSRIKLTLEATGNRFAVAFAPALEAVAVGFTGAMREGSGFRVAIEGIGDAVARFISLARDIQTVVGGVVGAIGELAATETQFGTLADAVGGMTAPFISIVGWVREAIAIVAHLIRTTGSLGEAMAALGPLAGEVWQRIGDGADYVRASVALMTAKMAGVFLAGVSKMAGAWVDFTWGVAEGLNSLFGTNLEGASGVITQELGRLRLELDDDVRSLEGFKSGAAESFTAPLKHLETLRSAVNTATQGAKTSLDDAARSAENTSGALDKLGGSGGGAADGIGVVKGATDALKDSLGGVRDSVKSTFSDIIFEAKSVKDAIGGLIKQFGKLAFDKGFDALFNLGADALVGGGKSGSGGGGWLGKLLSFDGGGYTGNGPRSGGLDGKGGFLAINHPQETIIDHTKGGSFGGSSGGLDVAVRVFVDGSGQLQAVVDGMTDRKIAANNVRRDQGFSGKVNAARAGTHKRSR